MATATSPSSPTLNAQLAASSPMKEPEPVSANHELVWHPDAIARAQGLSRITGRNSADYDPFEY